MGQIAFDLFDHQNRLNGCITIFLEIKYPIPSIKSNLKLLKDDTSLSLSASRTVSEASADDDVSTVMRSMQCVDTE